MPKTGTTTERGYGSDHQKARARAKRLVDSGDAYCWRCGEWLDPEQPWDYGHDDQDRSRYRGPEHVSCNRATAARDRHTPPAVVVSSRDW
jgi:hypothetical protein